MRSLRSILAEAETRLRAAIAARRAEVIALIEGQCATEEEVDATLAWFDSLSEDAVVDALDEMRAELFDEQVTVH
jgi:hypothetical protein